MEGLFERLTVAGEELGKTLQVAFLFTPEPSGIIFDPNHGIGEQVRRRANAESGQVNGDP